MKTPIINRGIGPFAKLRRWAFIGVNQYRMEHGLKPLTQWKVKPRRTAIRKKRQTTDKPQP